MTTNSAATDTVAGTQSLDEKRRNAMLEHLGEAFVKSYMGPVNFIDDAVLASPTSVNIFRRQFGYVSKLVNYEYQYRSWNGYNIDLLDRYAEIINEKLVRIQRLLTTRCAQITKLLETNGVDTQTTMFAQPLVTTVPITSNFALRFFNVLKDLDNLNMLTGTAAIMGVIDSKQRAEAEFTCKKAVRAFQAVLRNEVNKIYKEANRMHHAIPSNERDASQEAILAQQGQDLAKMTESLDNEVRVDKSLDFDGQDPGQVLDAATASVTAVNKPRSKPKASSDATATGSADESAAAQPATV